jgi:hypothetical protein
MTMKRRKKRCKWVMLLGFSVTWLIIYILTKKDYAIIISNVFLAASIIASVVIEEKR